MLLGYVYKLNPSSEQQQRMSSWLDMLKAQYNYRLAEQIDAYQQTKIVGEYCDLRTKATIQPLACSLTKGALYGDPFKVRKIKYDKTKETIGEDIVYRSAYEIQSADLVNLKRERSWL